MKSIFGEDDHVIFRSMLDDIEKIRVRVKETGAMSEGRLHSFTQAILTLAEKNNILPDLLLCSLCICLTSLIKSHYMEKYEEHEKNN